jgi:hypothetical protein
MGLPLQAVRVRPPPLLLRQEAPIGDNNGRKGTDKQKNKDNRKDEGNSRYCVREREDIFPLPFLACEFFRSDPRLAPQEMDPGYTHSIDLLLGELDEDEYARWPFHSSN